MTLLDKTAITRTNHGYSQRLCFSLPHPPVAVWAALTHRRGIEAWLGHFIEQCGTHLRVLPDGADDEVRIEIEQCRKPDHLEVLWVSPDEGTTGISCHLRPTPHGCLLDIRQEHLAHQQAAARYAARWARHIEQLDEFLRRD